MVTDYIRAAMHRAHYELIEDGTFVRTISGLQEVLLTRQQKSMQKEGGS